MNVYSGPGCTFGGNFIRGELLRDRYLVKRFPQHDVEEFTEVEEDELCEMREEDECGGFPLRRS